MAHDAQAMARRAAEAMWADDKASQGLGMTLDTIGPGMATVSMTVTEAMVNGHGLCHGGYIFLLADSAFAFACNSYNERTVAQSGQIAFIAPGRLGMRLAAQARERHRGPRSGIYDVTVQTAAGDAIAEFRGVSRQIAGKLVDG